MVDCRRRLPPVGVAKNDDMLCWYATLVDEVAVQVLYVLESTIGILDELALFDMIFGRGFWIAIVYSADKLWVVFNANEESEHVVKGCWSMS